MEALPKRTISSEETVKAVKGAADETNQSVKELVAMLKKEDPWSRPLGGEGAPG